MTNKDFEFFKKNRESIIKDHLEQFVVIKDEKIVGYFNTKNEAFEFMVGNELGSFIVQKCLPESQTVIEFYSNRIQFA